MLLRRGCLQFKRGARKCSGQTCLISNSTFFGKVFLFHLVKTELKLSALGPSGSFVWVALYLYTPKKWITVYWHCDVGGLNRMWCRKCHSPSDGKMIIFSTQQLQFNPTKSSRFQFRRSTAAIAVRARSRGNTVSSRAAHRRHGARGRAARALCTKRESRGQQKILSIGLFYAYLALVQLKECCPISMNVELNTFKRFWKIVNTNYKQKYESKSYKVCKQSIFMSPLDFFPPRKYNLSFCSFLKFQWMYFFKWIWLLQIFVYTPFNKCVDLVSCLSLYNP